MTVENVDIKIVSLLLSIGLNDREARIYSILLGKGGKRADEISKLSGIPQPHVYTILKTLQGKEIVEILPEKVKKYRAVPLDHAIERVFSEKERALIALKNKSAEIAMGIRVEENGIHLVEFKLIIGLNNMIKKVMEVLQDAKKDILAITSASMILNQIEYLPFLTNLKSRGVSLRVLIYPDIEKIERFKPLTDAGMQIKLFTQRNIHHKLIVDESVALVYVNCEEQIKQSDFEFWTTHKEIVKMSREEFEELWDKAKLYKI